ncbi:NAD-specific glutamate dehydrogenase [Babesia ovata]|uniref:E3 ubiquitin protein ligase n=1 Tax=Babesia ovata TaxID=189622 RepID=A0A2H6KD40_9APIC|nr:NAD-specific glutamate dehydrogenase [Babesia ovata]GBE60908.1 NAD-specific glutamate dehydrogenase [Babesia ovata]
MSRKRHKSTSEDVALELPLLNDVVANENLFKLRECLAEYRSEVDQLRSQNSAIVRENECLRHLCSSVAGIWDVLSNELGAASPGPSADNVAANSASAEGFLDFLSRTRLPFTVRRGEGATSSGGGPLSLEGEAVDAVGDGKKSPQKLESGDEPTNDELDSFLETHVEAFNRKKNVLLSRVKHLLQSTARSPVASRGVQGRTPQSSPPTSQAPVAERKRLRVLELASIRLYDTVEELRDVVRKSNHRCGVLEVEVSRLNKLNAELRYSLNRVDSCITPSEAYSTNSLVESLQYEDTPVPVINGVEDVTEELIVGSTLYKDLYELCKAQDERIAYLEGLNMVLRTRGELVALEYDRKLFDYVQQLEAIETELLNRVDEYESQVASYQEELRQQDERQQHLTAVTAELKEERDSLLSEVQGKDRILNEHISKMAMVIRTFSPSEDRLAAEPALADYKDQLQNVSLELEEISAAYEEKTRQTERLIQQVKEMITFRDKYVALEASTREMEGKFSRAMAFCERKMTAAYQHKEDLMHRIDTYRRTWVASYRRCLSFESKRDMAASALYECQAQLQAAERERNDLRSRLALTQAATHRVLISRVSTDKSPDPSSEEDSIRRENDALRRRMTCTVCSEHFRDRCLSKCGHVFCENCIKSCIKSRNRKCPVCKVAFDRNDVHLLDFLKLVLELLLGGGLVGLEPCDGLVDGAKSGRNFTSLELGLDVLLVEGVPHAVAVVLQLVLGLNAGAPVLVLLLVLLGLGNHALNVAGAETTLVVGDGDVLRLAGRLVHGSNVQDTVGVNVEGDLNLGNTPGSGGNAGKVELSEEVVVLGHGTLTLEDLNEHTFLVVLVGGEDLGLLGGDGSVPLDEHGHDTTSGLKTEGQGSDIEQQQLLDFARLVTRKNGGLDGGTVGNGLIRVDGAAGLLTVEEVLDELLDLRDTGGTSDEHDLVDLSLVKTTGLQGLLDGDKGAPELLTTHLLETSTADGGVVVDTLVEGVELNGGLGGAGKHTLGALTVGPETTEGTLVAGEVLAVVDPHEVADTVLDKEVVEVLTTEVGVTGSGLDLEDTVLNGKDGHIEGTTSKIEDEHVLLLRPLLVKTVGNGGGGGLVDDTHDVETGDGTSVLGGLTLGVVEVGGHGDDGVLDGLAEVELSNLLHLDEDHRGDFLRVEGLLLSLEGDLDGGLAANTVGDLEGPVLHVILDGGVVKPPSDEPLGVEDGVLGVAGLLVLGGVTNQTLSVGEGDVGGGGPVTLVIGDDLHVVVLVDTNTGVGGTQIDTNSRSRHFDLSFSSA